MSEGNKAIVEQIMDELWNQGRIGVIDELYAPDYADRSASQPPGIPPDREGRKQFVQAFKAAFPGIVGTTEDVIAEGDKVVLRWSAQGTHEGDFMGIPPTGREILLTGTTVYRIAGGKIAEEWTQADMLGLMTQLGVVPEMATA